MSIGLALSASVGYLSVRWIVVAELGSATPVAFAVGLIRTRRAVKPHAGVARLLNVDMRPQATIEFSIPLIVAEEASEPRPANKASQPMSASGVLGRGEFWGGAHGWTVSFAFCS